MEIVSTHVCSTCAVPFSIFQKDVNFYTQLSPTFAGKKFALPRPEKCPACREQQRMVFRNEQHLYHRRCDKTGKPIISQYHAGNTFPIYGMQAYHRRDREIPFLDYKPSKSFFIQLQDLQDITPRCALLSDMRSYNHNSKYQNAASRNQNCYLVFATGDCDDCLYGQHVDRSKDCIDCYQMRLSGSCYACVDCILSTNLFFSQDCVQCADASFLYDCHNCHDCIMCHNLRNQSYCIRNQQYTREEYLVEKANIWYTSYADLCVLKEESKDMALHSAHQYAHIVNGDNCQGDYMNDAKNIYMGYMVYESEESSYCFKLIKSHHCMDFNDWGDPAEWCYECITVGEHAYKCLFCNDCRQHCDNLLYCDHCRGCQDCFGCIGLGRKQYCVLNKQYTKEQYEVLVAEIISHMQTSGEWGKFFPISFSPFAYNKSLVHEYYPVLRKEALEKGYTRFDDDPAIDAVECTEAIVASELGEYEGQRNSDVIARSDNDEAISGLGNPSTSSGGQDTSWWIDPAILEKTILCSASGKPFRIVKPELAFYQQHGLPLPRMHPKVRHTERVQQRNSKTLWMRICSSCDVEILTTYAPEREEKVLCKDCYHYAVYG